MKTFRHEYIVNAGVQRVWEFFTDPNHFEVISPRNLNEILVKSSSSRLLPGTELWITTSLFIGRTWQATITRLEPYEYVDSVHDDLFKIWLHTHKFLPIDRESTAVMDEFAFECRYSIIGKILELLIMSRLGPIFMHREQRTKEIIEN